MASKYGPHGRHKIGGVQTWTATLADEFKRRGADVTLWEHGDRDPDGTFDLGVFSNWGHSRRHANLCKVKRIVTHGIIPDERPPTRRVLFTSEGVRDHWHGTGPILRQPIDLDFWSPAEAQKEFLVRFSYRGGLPFMSWVAARMDLTYYHLKNATPRKVRDVLRKAAVVAATGRAALEAMAVGAPVVICDHRRTYQGPLLDRDTLGSMARNYSGRGGVPPTEGTLAQACQQAQEVGSLRDHVVEHHDVRNIARTLWP